jgi:glucoamylase
VGGLGEPRYYVNGLVNASDWGRPQTDGPAARAITMSMWANRFLDEGGEDYVMDHLYRAELPATSPIKKDLEYLLYNWKIPTFDLWEESRGTHFYTLAMQRRAFVDGAALAYRMNDGGAAAAYSAEAEKVKEQMLRFFDAGKPYVVVTLDNDGGWTNKTQALDVAVIIAANHALIGDDFVDELLRNKKSMFEATQANLENVFRALYPINQMSPDEAPAIGRYPEDVYDGSGFSGANPWFIATHASAEFYCNLARLEPDAPAASKLKEIGRSFLARTLKHRDQQTGEFTEQFSRNNGYLVGARHLTWSYASYITAYLACR